MKLRAAFTILLLGVFAYLPGLSGGFHYDDFQNIVENTALRPTTLTFDSLLAAALSSDSGPLRRPVASLSFMANYLFAGSAPFSFKLTNVVIHVGNGVLLFALLLQLLPKLLPSNQNERIATRLAFLTALIWTLHSVNVTAVLYVVQRMTSLASTFILIACLAYCRLRMRAINDVTASRAIVGWIGILICMLLALGCKETGALLPVYLLVIELAAFDFLRAPRLRYLTLAGVSIAVLSAAYFVFVSDYLENSFQERPFTAYERGLTELRILWFYVGQIAIPTPGRFALFHSDWNVSQGIFMPWTTALSAFTWASLLGLAIFLRSRARLFFFAVAWFLGGHLLESTIVPLNLIYEHRNYLPSIGLISLILWPAATLPESQPNIGKIVMGGIVIVIGAMTFYRAWQWSDPITLALTEARHHPNSSSARYEYGRIRFRLYLAEKRPMDLAIARSELGAASQLGAERFFPLSGLIASYLNVGDKLPDGLLQQMERELSHEQPTPRRVRSVTKLIECQMTKNCRVAPDIILSLVGAVFENPKLPPSLKTEVLEWLAVYYANVLGDYRAAQQVITDALRIAPTEWSYQLRLVEILIAANDWPAAKTAARGLPASVEYWDRLKNPTLQQRLADTIQRIDSHQ